MNGDKLEDQKESTWARLIDASVILAAIAACNFVCQWMYLETYLWMFGLSMSSFHFATEDIVLADVFPIFIAVTFVAYGCFFYEKGYFQELDFRNLSETTRFVILVFLLLLMADELYAGIAARISIFAPHSNPVSFTLIGEQYSGYHILYKNEGCYYLYKSKPDSRWYHFSLNPDLIVVKADAIGIMEMK